MAPLGPFAPDRRLVVAVSGGADSMCLALLLRRWGAPLAVVVDHGLRAGSGVEAELTRGRLAGMGVPARVVGVRIAPGPGLGARARAARYGALLAVCRAEGLPDLALGHHAADQAETQVLRARRGSGAAGLAGRAAVAWRGEARLLRPLLGLEPGRLRATLRAAGVGWAEDPGNTDPATARGALRRGPLPAVDVAAGGARAGVEAAVAEELGRVVMLHPAGFARVAGALSAAGWSALVWTLSGRAHPPASRGAARLAAEGRGTLHGVLVRGGYAMREHLAADVPAVGGAVWDGRFVLPAGVPGAMVGATLGATLGALGGDARRFRGRAGVPTAVLRRFPCLRLNGELLIAPYLDFAAARYCPSVTPAFRPMRPLAGAAFAPSSGEVGDAHGAVAHHVVAGRETTPGSGLDTGLVTALGITGIE